MTKLEQVAEAAVELLRAAPGGLRYCDLVYQLGRRLPNHNSHMIQRAVGKLPQVCADVYKPWTGMYALRGVFDERFAPPPKRSVGHGIAERRFYDSFAEFIGALERCDRCVAVGGNSLGDLWGTPDVMGRIAARYRALVPYGDTFVAGELKTGMGMTMRAFGQACAYRLFAHCVYIAMPQATLPAELERLELLCRMFGIGLVVFNDDAPDKPDYRLLQRARPGWPDMAVLNDKAELLKAELYG